MYNVVLNEVVVGVKNIVVKEGDYKKIKNKLNKENDFYYKNEILLFYNFK